MPNRERRTSFVSRDEFLELSAKVTHLHDCIEKNTSITEDVRDILASFKVMLHIGKWVAAIAGAIAATLVAIKAGLDLRK